MKKLLMVLFLLMAVNAYAGFGGGRAGGFQNRRSGFNSQRRCQKGVNES